MYHYEFDNIDDLNNIIFKVSLPKVKNAKWSPYAGFFFIEKVTIQVFVENMLIDDRCVDVPMRILNKDINKNPNFLEYFPNGGTDEPLLFYIPLYPAPLEKSFAYLYNPDNKNLKYQIICDVKTNMNPRMNQLCLPFDKNIIPEVIGEFSIEEINQKDKEERIMIYI